MKYLEAILVIIMFIVIVGAIVLIRTIVNPDEQDEEPETPLKLHDRVYINGLLYGFPNTIYIGTIMHISDGSEDVEVEFEVGGVNKVDIININNLERVK